MLIQTVFLCVGESFFNIILPNVLHHVLSILFDLLLFEIVFPRCLFCIEIDLRDSSFLLSEISTIDFAFILTHPFEKLLTLHWLGNDLRDSKRLWKLK